MSLLYGRGVRAILGVAGDDPASIFAGGIVDSDTIPTQVEAPGDGAGLERSRAGAIPARQFQQSIDRITRQMCDEYRENSRQMAGYNITRETMVRLMDEGIAEYERIEPDREAEDEQPN